MNEPQPHPCFCVTTVGTWRGLPGDWSRGYVWSEVKGLGVSDVGANLLRVLELTDTPWVEILRSNGGRLNPLFFGIYGDTIYHHGAGFRTKSVVTRSDRDAAPVPRKIPNLPFLGRVIHRLNRRRRGAWREETEDSNRRQSESVYEKIAADEPDWPDYVRSIQDAGG